MKHSFKNYNILFVLKRRAYLAHGQQRRFCLCSMANNIK